MFRYSIIHFSRTSVLIVLFFLVTQGLFCRNDSTKFFIGLKVGAGFAYFKGIPDYMNLGYTNNFNGSAVVGFTSVYKFNKIFSGGIELLFNFRGGGSSKIKDSITYVNVYYNGNTVSSGPPRYYENHKIKSLDIPIYLKIGSYNRKFSPFLNIGLLPSFNMGYSLSYNHFPGGEPSHQTVDLKEKTNLYTTGYLIGAGFKFKRIVIELRYSYYTRTDIIALGNKVGASNYLYHLSFGVDGF